MRLKPDPNFFLRDLYRVSGEGLEPDPDHPGMWIITGPGLTPDPDHPGMLLIDTYVGVKDLALDPAVGYSYVPDVTLVAPAPPSYVNLNPDVLWSQGTVSATLRIRTDLFLDVIRGVSKVSVVREHRLKLDPIIGTSSVTASMPKPHFERVLLLDIIYGVSDVRIARFPDLSRNTPITLALTLGARLEALEPLVAT